MAVKTKTYKKNIEGFRDAWGIFHPIRSGNKEQGRLYDGGAAGDYDFPAEREERRDNNRKKADEIYEKRQLEEALDGALGEERKISLSQFVRKSGGLEYDPKDRTGNNRGELRMLSFKESKRRGIAHPKGRYTVDLMREQSNEAGYPNTRTEAEFLDLLERDMRTGSVLPFFSADYLTNPTTPKSFWTDKAREIGKAITFFTKRNKPAKVKKLEKARAIAQSLAKSATAEMKTSTKKKATTKKPAAKKPAAKKPAAKRPAVKTAKKTPIKSPKKATKKPVKNGVIETVAAIAVGASAAVGLVDRFSKKKPVSTKDTIHGGIVHNTQKKKKAAAPKKNRASQNVEHHENEFDRFLNLIEKGDYAKTRSAKMHGKLAGFSPNEIDRAIQYARLTHKLQKNPSAAVIAEAGQALKLKANGFFSERWAVRQAGKHYKRQLRLENKLAQVKARRSTAESKAKSKPKARRNPATAAAKKCTDHFYAFQGRFPGQTIEVERPEDCPRHTWSVGKLLEVRLKGGTTLYFNGKRKTFYLAADKENNQLWILGGSIASKDASIKKGYSLPVGEITHLVYETHKAHLDNKPGQGYIHKLGDEGGARPTLGRDRHGKPIIVGGDYTIEPLGIAN